jgi:hypothetical protein
MIKEKACGKYAKHFHDVTFNFVILEDSQTTIDQNRWMCRFEVCSEIRRWFLHVYRGDFQADGFQFRQEVQIHEILLTEQTCSFASTIDRGRLKYCKKCSCLI